MADSRTVVSSCWLHTFTCLLFMLFVRKFCLHWKC